VGVTGIVGHVAKYGEPRVALDVGADPAFFNNPDLPETRSEVALPLVAAERILGVLDIQSTESGAFDVEEVEALRVLTNQLAIAYQNAVQLAEARMALASLRQAGPRELELMAHGGQAPAYTATPDGRVERAPAEATVVPEAGSAEGAAWTQQTVDEGGRPTVLVPVTLRGELIGAIRVQSENVNRRWTANEIHLLESVAGRAATALENAGLLSRSERLAETQRAIGEIATNIGSSTRFDAILQTAARELSKALGGSEVMVQIEPRTVGATPRPESGS
jgi:GAF domain-containing protein